MLSVVRAWCCLLTLTVLAGALPAQAKGALASVRDRGYVICGVNDAAPGFSSVDKRGSWFGLDVDVCRAMAVAVLGNEKLAQFKPFDAADGLEALRRGEIDMLSRATDWTLSLDPEANARFVGPSFFDGQVILAPDQLGARSVLQLSSTRICMRETPQLRQGLEDYFGSRDMPIALLGFTDGAAALAGYEDRKCDVLTETLSKIGALQERLKLPDQHEVLPQMLSNVPLGPMVRQGDEPWFEVAQLVLNALVAAEEVGLSQQGPYIRELDRPTARVRLLMLEARLGERLGLQSDWGVNIVAKVGNYGELFERNLGHMGGFRNKRGNNNLWSKGGLFYTPLIR